MTLKARIAQLEQHEAAACIRQLERLSNDAYFARLAAITINAAPHLHARIRDETLRRFRLMTDDAIDALIRAHSTPEEYAWILARSDAELEAFALEYGP